MSHYFHVKSDSKIQAYWNLGRVNNVDKKTKQKNVTIEAFRRVDPAHNRPVPKTLVKSRR